LISDGLKPGKTAFRNFLSLPPSPGKVRLRISARGTSKELLEMAIERIRGFSEPDYNDIIVGYEEEERSSFGGDMLKKKVKPFYS
jgi:nicotinamide-nucleotide amidase